MIPTKEDLEVFKKLIDENRYDFCKLVYIIFPFGEPDHELEHKAPYDWQMEEWRKLSAHLADPATRFDTYRLIISSGNGAAKTAFGAMTFFMLMYTQRVRGRITANTDPQMKSIVWPEYDIWFRNARYSDIFFEKLGTSIKARDEKYSETWRLDTVTWSEESPAAISGLHNKGGCALYIFEEAPGIPAVIWDYAAGAFTETETIKIHLAFGNSDDPESKFEQNMSSPLWHSLRIDTRTLPYIDKKQINDWLVAAGGNEDHDDFRVRVRGLPRKSAKDSIINVDLVKAAIERRKTFDSDSVKMLPCVLGCDPAWQGGDETVIWMKQGNYTKILAKYKLERSKREDHMVTFSLLCRFQSECGADAVFIDQAEGTGIITLANNAGFTHWYLIAFGSNPNDKPDPKESEYANMRAMMYYKAAEFLGMNAVIDAEEDKWIEEIEKQLPWAKGTRHKVTGKKLVESKVDIRARVGRSPDIADGFVLCLAMEVTERLFQRDDGGQIGEGALKMPDHPDPYADMEVHFERLYQS